MNRPLEDMPDQALIEGHAFATDIIRGAIDEGDTHQAEVFAAGALGVVQEMCARGLITEIELAEVELATRRLLGARVS